MFVAIVVLHILLCVSLMGLVLIQQGKGADAGAIMGGGSDALLGAGSAGNVISKVTTSLAIGFMVTSIILVKFYERGMENPAGVSDLLEGSVMQGVETTDPVLPGTVEDAFDTAEEDAAVVPAPAESDAEPAVAALPGAEQVEDPVLAVPQEDVAADAASEAEDNSSADAGTAAENVVEN